MSDSAAASMRLDKWLWSARFYKTRSLAAEAIASGRVQVNAERAKPAKNIRPGDSLFVRKPPFEFTLTVKALSERRGPAVDARLLYEETPASVAAREKLATELRDMPPPLFKGRPTKKDRRDLERVFGNSHGDDE